MELLNEIVKDMVPFAAANKLDLLGILQLIDIVLCQMEVNQNDDDEVNHYVDTILYMNHLLSLFRIQDKWPEKYKETIFNSERINKIRQAPESVIRFQKLRLNVYDEEAPEIFKLSLNFK